MGTVYLEMDGTTVGFKVNLFSNGGYLKTRNGTDRIFTNLEFARTIAYINGAKIKKGP